MIGNESPKPVSIPLLNILAISGSLRAASTNSALLAALAQNAPPDCHVSVYDGLGRLPIFNPDEEGERTPLQAAVLIDAVTAADGVIVSCPEYAHGVPGGLKNALDWLVSRDAAVGKPATLVHASPRSLFARAALAEVNGQCLSRSMGKQRSKSRCSARGRRRWRISYRSRKTG
ncbi:NADPH-dependent FMN reductase [Mesorhizobium sp. M0814]|uniref:NADPH-dependent FMN reductase n=1 Tax=unclassified Mesorhizobium TaxID=325217 RepID=UPI00333A0A3E